MKILIRMILVLVLCLSGCATTTLPFTANASVKKKLKTTVVPEIWLKDALIRDVVATMQAEATLDDAPKDPQNIVLLVLPKDAESSIPRLNFNATDISLYDLTTVVAELSGLVFLIEDGRPWLKYKEPDIHNKALDASR